MSVIGVNKENFEKEVLECDKPVLVDFYATWCGPCKMVSPIIDEIANENSDIKVCKVNVDDEQELAISYKVMSIPTLAVFKGGELVKIEAGAKSKSQILQMIK